MEHHGEERGEGREGDWEGGKEGRKSEGIAAGDTWQLRPWELWWLWMFIH